MRVCSRFCIPGISPLLYDNFMALLKIYSLVQNRAKVLSEIGNAIKIIGSAALNCETIPTSPAQIETVYVEGVDLIGIDYIIEIIACERPHMQQIADDFIFCLNAVYPGVKFSVYFNLIKAEGMANTLRAKQSEAPLTLEQAVERARG